MACEEIGRITEGHVVGSFQANVWPRNEFSIQPRAHAMPLFVV